MESPSTNQLHLRRIAGINAILFFFFWLIILLAGPHVPKFPAACFKNIME